jgi:hypothetical protein
MRSRSAGISTIRTGQLEAQASASVGRPLKAEPEPSENFFLGLAGSVSSPELLSFASNALAGVDR